MGGIAKITMLAAAVAAALTIAWPSPSRAQDLYSLQARVMQLEARVRDISTFRPATPPTQSGDALSQRIRTLELSVATQQNAIENLRAEIEALKKAPQR